MYRIALLACILAAAALCSGVDVAPRSNIRYDPPGSHLKEAANPSPAHILARGYMGGGEGSGSSYHRVGADKWRRHGQTTQPGGPSTGDAQALSSHKQRRGYIMGGTGGSRSSSGGGSFGGGGLSDADKHHRRHVDSGENSGTPHGDTRCTSGVSCGGRRRRGVLGSRSTQQSKGSSSNNHSGSPTSHNGERPPSRRNDGSSAAGSYSGNVSQPKRRNSHSSSAAGSYSGNVFQPKRRNSHSSSAAGSYSGNVSQGP